MTETLIYALTKFVAIPSVSSQPQHKEDCRQAAIWLKKAAEGGDSNAQLDLYLDLYNGRGCAVDRRASFAALVRQSSN